MVLLFLWIAASAAGPSVASILQRMNSLAIPDTADYRTVTTVHMQQTVSTVTSHVIQAGPSLRRMEIDAGGRRSLLVTNGGKSTMTDLATNRSVAVPSTQANTDPSAALRAFLATRWSTPRNIEGNVWELSQDVSGDSSVRARTVRWDEADGEVESLLQVGASGDTTEMRFEWIRSGGHKVPSAMTIQQTVRGGGLRVGMSFSDWRFPRSLPSSLFAVP